MPGEVLDSFRSRVAIEVTGCVPGVPLDQLIRQHQITMAAGMRYLPGICAPSSDLHQRFGWLRALRAPQRPRLP